MRKFMMIAALAVAALASGCATKPSGVLRASDTDVAQAATGKLLSMEEGRRGTTTVTNTAAGLVSSSQGSSTLGLLGFAVDVLDHENAKNRDRYLLVKIQDETTNEVVVFHSSLLTIPKYADVGDRVRMIYKKNRAEAMYNLTRNPQYDEMTR